MRRRLRIAAAGALALALLCATALATSGGALARARELDEAERRWAGRQFGEYTMVMEDLTCVVDIRVRNERVLDSSTRNRCHRDGRSVSDLFALIHRDGGLGTRCITQGCACDDELTVRAVYDPTLGYPVEINLWINARPNWRSADFWRLTLQRLRPPTCEFPVGHKIIRVLELHPE